MTTGWTSGGPTEEERSEHSQVRPSRGQPDLPAGLLAASPSGFVYNVDLGQFSGAAEIFPKAGETSRAGETSPTSHKRPTPAGKVKASFNLLPEDIDSLRAMAKQLGTTVTNVIQRSIRDERFIQDQLAEGNRFAVVDRKGTIREIIWR